MAKISFNKPQFDVKVPELNIPDDLTLQQALGVLADFARSGVLSGELDAALVEVFGADIWAKLDHQRRVAFLEYFIFDRKTKSHGKTPASLFADSAIGLTDKLRAKFAALTGATPDHYLAQSVAGDLLTMRRLGTSTTFTVRDKAVATSLKRGEIVVARIVEWEGNQAFTGIISRRVVESLEQFDDEMRSLREELPAEPWRQEMGQFALRMLLGTYMKPEEDAAAEFESLDDEELAQAAAEAFGGGEYKLAAIGYEELVQRLPDSFEYRFKLGLALMQSGQFGRAMSIFEPIVAENPDNTPARVNLAISQSMTGNEAEALRNYQLCLLKSPDERLLPTILNGIGLVAKAMGDDEQSRKAFERAVKLSEGDAGALEVIVGNMIAAGFHAEALKVARKLSDIAPTADAFLRLGDLEMTCGSSAKALKAYQKALELDKTRPETIRRIGDACLREGKLKQAEGQYETYLAVVPGDVQALNSLGVARMNNQKVEEAEEAFKLAITTRPDYAAAWGNLGKLLIMGGRLDGARQAVDKARSLDPDNLVFKELEFILEEEELKRGRKKPD